MAWRPVSVTRALGEYIKEWVVLSGVALENKALPGSGLFILGTLDLKV